MGIPAYKVIEELLIHKNKLREAYTQTLKPNLISNPFVNLILVYAETQQLVLTCAYNMNSEDN